MSSSFPKQAPMRYSKKRGLHIGQRWTDGLGANAVMTPEPQNAVSSKDAEMNRQVGKGLAGNPMPKAMKLKETN